MHVNTYLSFDGDCRQALESYAQLLGGKVMAMMTFGEMPPQEGCGEMPASVKDRIMHGAIAIGGQVLMGTDATPDHPYAGVTGSYVTVQTAEVAEAERVFAALADGARRIEMPLQETFWARRYGSLVDRYGVPWMVNCSDPCQDG